MGLVTDWLANGGKSTELLIKNESTHRHRDGKIIESAGPNRQRTKHVFVCALISSLEEYIYRAAQDILFSLKTNYKN